MAELIALDDEQLRELQQKSLEMAEYVVTFCRKRDIRVYFYAGSMLGAIREKGFIPWDDDIDLVFPAPDYERFVELWSKEADTEKYSLCRQTKDYNDHTLTDSIRDNGTTFITDSTVNEDVNQGLAIDIALLHAAPPTRIGQRLQLVLASGASLFRAGRVPARQKKAVTIAARVILAIFRTNTMRYAMWHTMETLATRWDKNWDNAELVREFTMFPFITWLFSRKWFDGPTYVPFEGTEAPVPIGYDGYLSKRYGDYMRPPEVKERHPEHRIVFIDLDTPYKEYRGVKYLVDSSKE